MSKKTLAEQIEDYRKKYPHGHVAQEPVASDDAKEAKPSEKAKKPSK